MQVSRLRVDELLYVFATALRDEIFTHYENVAIVAHSMGGVVLTGALRVLVANEPHFGRRLRAEVDPPLRLAVAFMGVPRAGRITYGLRRVNAELRALAYNNGLLRLNNQFWQNRVVEPERIASADDLPVRSIAVISERDLWVPQASAELGLRSENLASTDYSHTNLVKPPADGPHAPYEFVRNRLQQFFETRSAAQESDVWQGRKKVAADLLQLTDDELALLIVVQSASVLGGGVENEQLANVVQSGDGRTSRCLRGLQQAGYIRPEGSRQKISDEHLDALSRLLYVDTLEADQDSRVRAVREKLRRTLL